MPKTTHVNTDAAAFVAALVAQNRRLVGASIISLDALADELYHCDMPEHRTRTRRAARREILEKTEGLPLRFDTPTGPVFNRDATWRYAFGTECYEQHQGWPGLPTWSGELRAAA